jgi:hypothetical protein
MFQFRQRSNILDSALGYHFSLSLCIDIFDKNFAYIFICLDSYLCMFVHNFCMCTRFTSIFDVVPYIHIPYVFINISEVYFMYVHVLTSLLIMDPGKYFSLQY